MISRSQALRLLSLLSKLALLGLIITFGNSRQIFEFNLSVSAAALCIYALGFEVYYFYNRMYMTANKFTVYTLSLKQLQIYLLIYLILTPILIFLLCATFDSLILSLACLIYATFEHFNLEIYRYYCAVAKTEHATRILALRSTIQLFIAAIYIYTNKDFEISILLVLLSIPSSGFVVHHIYRKLRLKRAYLKFITKNSYGDFSQIIRKAYIPLISSIVLQTYFVLDKKIIAEYYGITQGAKYSTLIAIGMVVITFTQSGPALAIQRNMREYFISGNYGLFNAELTKYGIRTLRDTFIFTFILLIVLPVIAHIIGKTFITDNSVVVISIMLFSAVQSFCFIPHTLLYVTGKDRDAFLAGVAHPVVNIIILSATVVLCEFESALLVLAVFQIVIFLARMSHAIKITRHCLIR